MFVGGSALVFSAGRRLPEIGRSSLATPGLLVIAALLILGALGLEILGHLATGLDPRASSYGAMVYMAAFLTGQAAFATAVLCLFAVARQLTGQLDSQRRVTFDNAAIFYYYTSAQGLFGLVLIHGFPRLIG